MSPNTGLIFFVVVSVREEEMREKRTMKIVLNVGGRRFETRKQLLEESDSFFSGLLKCEWSEEVFIDRDPTHFRYVLNWLRGCRSLPEDRQSLIELKEEAQFFALADMDQAISIKKSFSLLESVYHIHKECRKL